MDVDTYGDSFRGGQLFSNNILTLKSSIYHQMEVLHRHFMYYLAFPKRINDKLDL
jgi:hypothetical protein